MLTKYLLYIGAEAYELQHDDLKNWDEVKCVYKRAEYGGVTRSFTSKFEFTNKAYRLLMEEFDSNGFQSKAVLVLYVINNNWTYSPLYSCELDFSTLSYTDYVLSINAIDESIESVIKANKSTKFQIGVNECETQKYLFDRVKMVESASYHISDGVSQDDGSLYGFYLSSNNGRIMIGITGSEIAVGGGMMFEEDQEYGDGYLLQAYKDTSLSFEYSIGVDRLYGSAELILMVNDNEVETIVEQIDSNPPLIDGYFNEIEDVMQYIEEHYDLKNNWDTAELDGSWVEVKGMVYEVHTTYEETEDAEVIITNEWIATGKTKAEYQTREFSGTVVVDFVQGDKVWIKYGGYPSSYSYTHSKLVFRWENRGERIIVNGIRPLTLLSLLLEKMGVEMSASISSYDPRLSNVLLLPAESIRDIPEAKIYCSFSEFCKWMEAVFGYIYIVDPESQTIEFKHRNEIFSDDAEVFEIDLPKEIEYIIAKDTLFSTVTVGYGKKDYDSINGRDEFNFGTSYSTGCKFNGKKLELISPFRADSYGIEFLAEKRSQDTTDNVSDKDIFFVQGVNMGGGFYGTYRQPVIQNSITGTLINGEFSPMQCAEANREYISIMAPSMELSFASTEGNSDIVIDGVGMTENLIFEDCDMLTAGELKFTCGDVNLPKDMNNLIRVKGRDFIYTGYVRQLSFALARPEAIEYTLMIKTKVPC